MKIFNEAGRLTEEGKKVTESFVVMANDLIGTDAKGIVDPSAIDPLVAAHREPSTCPLHREFPCLRKDGSSVD